MSHVLMALILFGLGLWAALNTKDGFDDGTMPALLSSRISPLRFDRRYAPTWFWGAAILNVALAAGFVVAGILLLAVGPTR